jgi:hypothetical protein
MKGMRPYRLAIVLLHLLVGISAARAAMPSFCLPPLFENGRRLHPLPVPDVFWLEPALRQHELCWWGRAHPAQPRAVLIGSSAVYGLPLPVDDTVSERLNAHLARVGVPGHVFNLGWVGAYQLRDAVILDAALAYEPDLIIYAVTLADFNQLDSSFPTLREFFLSNHARVVALAASQPPGLEEPLARLAASDTGAGYFALGVLRLRESGALVRDAVRAHADSLARHLDPTYPLPSTSTAGRQPHYDCAETLRSAARLYGNWQSWNILAYLEQVRAAHALPILIVNWPIAHEPVESCYNVRHSTASVEEFNRWLPAEAAARGLGYVDLHDLLPPELFVDSLHVTAEGHHRIAEQLAPVVETMLRDLGEHRSAAAASHAP